VQANSRSTRNAPLLHSSRHAAARWRHQSRLQPSTRATGLVFWSCVSWRAVGKRRLRTPRFGFGCLTDLLTERYLPRKKARVNKAAQNGLVRVQMWHGPRRPLSPSDGRPHPSARPASCCACC